MNEEPTKSFWQRRIVDPLVQQLKQGITPQKLALSCALGIAIGIFPVVGSTTLLCLLFAFFLKLNQPAMQVVNYLIYPVQLVLVPVFVRTGETLFHAEHVPLTPTLLTKQFMAGPGPFLAKYGMAGVYGITAWALIAPFLVGGFYVLLSSAFRKI